MRKISVICLCIVVGLLLIACSEPVKEPFEALLSYKATYIGDASAVGAIIRELPGAECHVGIELETASEPYGLTVRYDVTNEVWRKVNKQNLVMYNSAALFALIDNVESITYSFEGSKVETLHILRSDIESIIGQEWAYYLDARERWENELYKPLYLEE